MPLANHLNTSWTDGASPSTTWDNIITLDDTNGGFVLKPSLVNLAAGDTVEFRALEEDAGGTLRVVAGPWVFKGPQSVVQPPLSLGVMINEWMIQARQSGGATPRAVPFRVDIVT